MYFNLYLYIDFIDKLDEIYWIDDVFMNYVMEFVINGYEYVL